MPRKMCFSKTKLQGTGLGIGSRTVSHINGRPVLQPTCNRVPLSERRDWLKKAPLKFPTPPLQAPSSPAPSPPPPTAAAPAPLVSPKLKSPRLPAVKRGSDPNGLNTSVDKVLTPRSTAKSATLVKKAKRWGGDGAEGTVRQDSSSLKYSSSLIVEAPGSIAAARREQVAIMQVQRKMRIAHYGRAKSATYQAKVVPLESSARPAGEKRCTFVTPNSDPIYVAYHDEEWGVPVHDDKLLFELLVLTGAQIGSDWTSVLMRRQELRDAFSAYDAEIVSRYTEKKITSIGADYGMDPSQVRGAVDNARRILEIKREMGSFDKYLWAFVNGKPIATGYKSCNKIPAKTAKSEAISKDMVRRGFRFVGPSVVHSFMQAAGLTNDHLLTCARRVRCLAEAEHPTSLLPS